MSLLRKLAGGARSLFRKHQTSKELDEEFDSFVEMATQDKMKDGMTRAEAVRAVRLERGSREVAKEVVYAAGWESVVDGIWRDICLAVRSLQKSPEFSVAAVLTLASGIGANTAIFTMVNGLMLQALPVRDPEQLVEILHHSPGEPEPGFNGFSLEAYQSMRDGNHVLSHLIIGSLNVYIVRGHGLESQTVFGGNVGGTFFEALGVRPAIGRLIGPQDTDMDSLAVAVVSWSFWKSRFNLDPAIVGRRIIANNTPLTIIGVTERRFYGL